MTPTDPHQPSDPDHRRFLFRKIFLPAFCLAALVGVFYIVENMRGRNAWESVKSELKAKGETLDWDKFIPKPIPDADNMLKVPDLEAWFVHNYGKGAPEWFDPKAWEPDLAALSKAQTTVGALEFISPASAPSATGSGWSEALTRELTTAVATSDWSQATDISDTVGSIPKTITHLAPQRVDELPRLNLKVQAAAIPTPAEINKALTELAGPYTLEARTGESPAKFDLVLTKTTALNVPDFLAKTDAFQAQFDIILDAARRSGAYRTGDYRSFNNMPFPPFRGVRSLGRCASLRARCHLFLTQPAQALKDLELIQAARKTIGPTELSLVAAMIDTVLCGNSLDTVQFGLDRHQWRPSDLVALAAWAENEHAPQTIFQGLRSETAGNIKWQEELMETRPSMAFGSATTGDKAASLLFQIVPRGWFQQNMRNHTQMMFEIIDIYDRKTGIVSPEKSARAENSASLEGEESGPYHYFSRTAIPAFQRVTRVAARTQTQAHLTVLGCALERHRLDTGSYPAKLESLLPKYLAKFPHQTVNGDPFLYRLETDGGYSLWSVGWDLKDDGGKFEVGEPVREDKADWGWRMTKP